MVEQYDAIASFQDVWVDSMASPMKTTSTNESKLVTTHLAL